MSILKRKNPDTMTTLEHEQLAHERDEEGRRRDRDAAVNARQGALDRERERMQGTELQSTIDNREREESRPAREAETQRLRAEGARTRMRIEEIAAAERVAFRQEAQEAAIAARSAEESAVANHDLSTYLVAARNHEQLRKLLVRLDSEEQTRQEIARHPFIHGAARV